MAFTIYLQTMNESSPQFDASKCGVALSEENRGKNRVETIVPADNQRAYLSTPVKGSNEYINAVFLPVSSPSRNMFLLR